MTRAQIADQLQFKLKSIFMMFCTTQAQRDQIETTAMEMAELMIDAGVAITRAVVDDEGIAVKIDTAESAEPIIDNKLQGVGVLTSDAIEALQDLLSHYSNFRDGLTMLRAVAPVAASVRGAEDDGSYYDRELLVLTRMAQQARSALITHNAVAHLYNVPQAQIEVGHG